MNYILVDGRPTPEPDPMAWARWFESADRTIGRTVVGGATVSTVFLGMDHSFLGGPPLLYETMIFGGPHDQDQWRYATLEEATAGHEAAAARLRAEADDPAPPDQPPG